MQLAQQIPMRQWNQTAFYQVIRGFIICLALVGISYCALAYYYSTQDVLIGRWVDKSGWNTYLFNSDGTATWDFHAPGMLAVYDMTYTADGHTLTENFQKMNGQMLSSRDQFFRHPLVRTYRVTGGELVIRNPDNGIDWTFNRE